MPNGQALRFLAGHDDVVAQILRGTAARATLHPALLAELALVAAVVARAAIVDLRGAAAADPAGFELAGQLARIQVVFISN